MLTGRAIVCAAALAFAGLLTPFSAHADVAGNTLGPGDSYSDSAYLLNGLGVQPPILQAFRFTAAATGRATRVVAPIDHFDGENRYFFIIASDNGGAPGTVLVQTGPVAGSVDATAPPVQVEIDAGQAITLVRGTSYWLVGACTETTQGFWHQNDQGQVGMRAVKMDGGPWTIDTTTLAAFRVEVTPVPCAADVDHNGAVEPADVALFVATWFTGLTQGTLAGDFDGNGIVEPADVSLFVSTWFAALTNGC